MDEESTKLIQLPDDRDASAVDGDAEDNTTTVDCSSDDKAKTQGNAMLASKSGLPVPGVSGSVANPPPSSSSSKTRRTRCRAGKKQDQICRKRGGGAPRPGAGGGQQRKRRRGKTKRNNRNYSMDNQNNAKKSVNWRLPEQDPNYMNIPPYPLVPYNTNRFLMEYHMADVQDTGTAPVNRVEFLTNEFSTVYETARSERLEGLTKPQLIQEYMQLEANYDRLQKQRINTNKSSNDGSGTREGHQHHHHHQQQQNNKLKWEAHWRALKDQVRKLSAENHELKSELLRIKGCTGAGKDVQMGPAGDESVDSESDSSVSSISTISRSSSRSSSSSSGSGSCCSSRCSSRDSRGNLLPNRLNANEVVVNNNHDHNAEAVQKENDVVMMGDEEGDQQRSVEESNGTDRPTTVNHHHRHRTHRQRRNSRLSHQSSLVEAEVETGLENGHMEDA